MKCPAGAHLLQLLVIDSSWQFSTSTRIGPTASIVISISICVVLYVFVAVAVGANLSIGEIIQAKDYSLAEASRPAFGQYGAWFTIAFAIIATSSGVVASIFAGFKNAIDAYINATCASPSFFITGRYKKTFLNLYVSHRNISYHILRFEPHSLHRCSFYIVMDIFIHWGSVQAFTRWCAS